jgi:hypothetical protein
MSVWLRTEAQVLPRKVSTAWSHFRPGGGVTGQDATNVCGPFMRAASSRGLPVGEPVRDGGSGVSMIPCGVT